MPDKNVRDMSREELLDEFRDSSTSQSRAMQLRLEIESRIRRGPKWVHETNCLCVECMHIAEDK